MLKLYKPIDFWFVPNIFCMICILGYVLWLQLFVDIYWFFIELIFPVFEENADIVFKYMLLPFWLFLLHIIQYNKFGSDDDMSEKVLWSMIAFLLIPVVLTFLHELIIDTPVEVIEWI